MRRLSDGMRYRVQKGRGVRGIHRRIEESRCEVVWIIP